MKNYDIEIYRMHLRDVREEDDPFKIETYLKGIMDLANGFNTEEQASGVLDKNDILQECYYVLVKTWNKMDLDAIREEADNPQAYIWSYLKTTVKLQARDWIHAQKDGQRIPKNKRYEITETKNVDDFLTQLFPPEFFADNAESMGLTYEENLNRYDIEQLGLGLDDVMRNNLSNKEQFVLESYFGVDRPKISSKQIAKDLGITVSNVDKTKFVALNKLKNDEIREYLKDFYHFE